MKLKDKIQSLENYNWALHKIEEAVEYLEKVKTNVIKEKEIAKKVLEILKELDD